MSAGSKRSSLVLRAAVVVDDTVTADLHQEQAASVSVGTSYRSDLLMFGPGAPEHHPMFEYKAGRFILDLPEGARGKLKLRGRKVGVRSLAAAGHKRVELDSRAKGRLLLGHTKLSFELTEPKRVEPKPPFPTEFKVTLALTLSTMGALYLYSLLGSALTLGSFFVWASFAPIPDQSEVEIDERFLIVMNMPRKDKTELEEPEEEEADELAQEEEKVEKEKKPEKEPLKEKPEKFTKQAMKEARSVGVARVLGTYGGPGEGTVFDVINETENNLGELFARGMTTTVMADGGDISEFVPGGEGISANGGTVQTAGLQTGDGPALADKSTKRERKIKGKAKTTKTDITGDGDKTALRATIKYRTSALQHCYNKALRTQPDLAGKMTFTIFISVMGTVTKVVVEEDSLGAAAVNACATAKIKGWRFPMDGAEEGAEVTFSVVFSGS